MQLAKEGDLLDLAREAGVDLILSGHTHESTVYVSSREVPVVCCGTTSQTRVGNEPRAHALFELSVERNGALLTAEVRLWEFDLDASDFRRARGWRINRSQAGATSIAQLP